MTDSNFNLEPLVFKELPKEQQKALRKEFSESTKSGRTLILVSFITGAVMIAFAVIGLFTDHRVFTGAVFPVWIVPVFIALNEDKLAKWLKAEKNIIMKREKQKS